MAQKRRSTAIRKQQIIDAARRLISKKGSEHLTVRAVAKEVGLTEAAIYRHFKSKRDVLSFLMKHILDSMLDEIEKSAGEYPHSLDALRSVFQHHLSEIEQRRGMSFQIIAEIISLGDKRLNREVYEKLSIYIHRIGELLSLALHAGAVRADLDVNAAALLLFGMIQGLANLWALSGYSFDLPVRFESLWNTFHESISERTSAGGMAS